MNRKILPLDPYLELDHNDDCSIEQEIEYNKMLKQLNSSIDMSYLTRLTKNQYLIEKNAWYKDIINHSKEVSELSENLCSKLFFPTKLVKIYWTTVCKFAGYFHEAITFGACYEEILKISDKNVANIISEITPDNRYPQHKKCIELKNIINQSNQYTKIVALADLNSELEYLMKAIRTNQKKLDNNIVSDNLKLYKAILAGISESEFSSETINEFLSNAKKTIKTIEEKINIKF